jgi:predicted AAA+ superfamily ATPase
VSAKVVEDYFNILEDLLIAVRLPVFTKRAKRRLISHPKFYYFDTGVFQAIRPRGPLDAPEQVQGVALETLFLEQVRAHIDYKALDYRLYYWRTASGNEVDFILYGDRGLLAFEIKMTQRVRSEDLQALQRFRADFPQAKTYFLYLGNRRQHNRGVDVLPFLDCISHLDHWL